MLDDRLEYLWFHTKVALVWLILGGGIGGTMCYYVMKDAQRPVVELRVDPHGATANGASGNP